MFVSTFMIISSWISLRMRNVSDKSVERIKTHIVCPVHFFSPHWKLCRLWDNVEKYGRAGQAAVETVIQRIRIVCWITHTHTLRISNTAYPLLQWLGERAWYVYTHISCIVLICWGLWWYVPVDGLTVKWQSIDFTACTLECSPTNMWLDVQVCKCFWVDVIPVVGVGRSACLLTPWRRVLLEKLTGLQRVK